MSQATACHMGGGGLFHMKCFWPVCVRMPISWACALSERVFSRTRQPDSDVMAFLKTTHLCPVFCTVSYL